MVVDFVVLIIRLRIVFAKVNTASQAIRRDINKLLRKAYNLTELER